MIRLIDDRENRCIVSNKKHSASCAHWESVSCGLIRVFTLPEIGAFAIITIVCFITRKIMHYYNEDDLARFGEIGKHKPELFEKFMAWYQACQEEGSVTKREKALIGLAVAHTIQCPYCIDAFTQSCLESGSNLDQMTEAIHLASAIRGGASLIHGIQAHNAHNKISM